MYFTFFRRKLQISARSVRPHRPLRSKSGGSLRPQTAAPPPALRDAESVENADEAGEASDPAGETDLADNGGEELPEGEENAEPIVERIALTGPFEIIVEGLEGNGEITVFRFTENGMEELAATRTEWDLRFQVN